jgi:hypothetical protein
MDRTRSTIGKGLALALAALALGPIVSWAVLVSPHAVFIDARSKTGQVTLVNRGTSAEEVRLEAKFGYPVTDSAGNISVRMFDAPPPDQPSAAGWLRIFPQRVVVQPGERQVVRLLAQPPADLPEGEYWSRLIITSQGAQVPVQGTDTTVRAGVSLIVSTVISVTYRNGRVQTGVRLDDFRAEDNGDSLIAWVGLTRQGNAAYLGTTWIRLRDASGRVVKEWDTPTAVYYSVHRRYAFPLDSVPPGSYTADLDVTTARADLDSRYILPAAPIQQGVAVEVR